MPLWTTATILEKSSTKVPQGTNSWKVEFIGFVEVGNLSSLVPPNEPNPTAYFQRLLKNAPF